MSESVSKFLKLVVLYYSISKKLQLYTDYLNSNLVYFGLEFNIVVASSLPSI